MQLMPPPEEYKNETGSQPTTCQVHTTGTYVSLLAPENARDYTACHPENTSTYLVYILKKNITRGTYHYAYARRTQVKWKKKKKK